MLNRDCVIVIGNEANGVSDGIARLCSLCRLPMLGRAESLNASAAASILILKRQKNQRNRILIFVFTLQIFDI